MLRKQKTLILQDLNKNATPKHFYWAELSGSEFEKDLGRLMQRGGYPEPFLAQENS